MGQIRARGLRWNANRIQEAPDERGVVVVFDESRKNCEIDETQDIRRTLRDKWWKHNFWYFSWFQTSPVEYCCDLKKELETMSYDEIWEFDQKTKSE